jgi:hypothetical protein
MAGDEHPELRLHDVRLLALVPADPVQLALAAPAGSVVGIDDDSLASCAATFGKIFSFKETRHALPLVKQDSSRRTAASRLFC